MLIRYKEKIFSFTVGVITALISMLIYQIIQKLDTLWITILAIFINVIINFIIAAISYQLQTDNVLTEGDLYINQYGGINFNLGIILLAATLQFDAYFKEGTGIYDYVLCSCMPFWILIYYSKPVPEYDMEDTQ
jgi:hypothetical protein